MLGRVNPGVTSDDKLYGLFYIRKCLNFRHRASCILGQAFRYSPENAFYTVYLINEYI